MENKLKEVIDEVIDAERELSATLLDVGYMSRKQGFGCTSEEEREKLAENLALLEDGQSIEDKIGKLTEKAEELRHCNRFFEEKKDNFRGLMREAQKYNIFGMLTTTDPLHLDLCLNVRSREHNIPEQTIPLLDSMPMFKKMTEIIFNEKDLDERNQNLGCPASARSFSLPQKNFGYVRQEEIVIAPDGHLKAAINDQTNEYDPSNRFKTPSESYLKYLVSFDKSWSQIRNDDLVLRVKNFEGTSKRDYRKIPETLDVTWAPTRLTDKQIVSAFNALHDLMPVFYPDGKITSLKYGESLSDVVKTYGLPDSFDLSDPNLSSNFAKLIHEYSQDKAVVDRILASEKLAERWCGVSHEDGECIKAQVDGQLWYCTINDDRNDPRFPVGSLNVDGTIASCMHEEEFQEKKRDSQSGAASGDFEIFLD